MESTLSCGRRPPVLTARLVLREFVTDDFDAIHADASDPEVTRYMFHGPQTMEDTREGDLGFIFAREVWGQGDATEAARAMVRTAFEKLGLDRIAATCNIDNHASARVLEKVQYGLGRDIVRH